MNYDWIEKAALAHTGAAKDYKAEWEAYRFLVGGKMFAMLGEHKDGRPIVTAKLLPADGALLRQQYPDIIPGYYMNKDHWNSVYLDGNTPQDVIVKMLGESYGLVLDTLPKKTQKELLGN